MSFREKIHITWYYLYLRIKTGTEVTNGKITIGHCKHLVCNKLQAVHGRVQDYTLMRLGFGSQLGPY